MTLGEALKAMRYLPVKRVLIFTVQFGVCCRSPTNEVITKTEVAHNVKLLWYSEYYLRKVFTVVGTTACINGLNRKPADACSPEEKFTAATAKLKGV